jgi:inorganic pyrophosphatase
MTAFDCLPWRDSEQRVQVVVETPRGSPVKMRFDPALQAFAFHRQLPRGVAYPFDWGFVPSTRAADGDPLDAMVLFDGATWPGIVIPTRPIGVVRLVQTSKNGKPEENDRIIAVPFDDDQYEHAGDIAKRLRTALERFFVIVGKAAHSKVEVTGWEGPKKAMETIEEAVKNHAGQAKRG